MLQRVVGGRQQLPALPLVPVELVVVDDQRRRRGMALTPEVALLAQEFWMTLRTGRPAPPSPVRNVSQARMVFVSS